VNTVKGSTSHGLHRNRKYSAKLTSGVLSTNVGLGFDAQALHTTGGIRWNFSGKIRQFWRWSRLACGSRIGFSDFLPLLERAKMFVSRITQKLRREWGDAAEIFREG